MDGKITQNVTQDESVNILERQCLFIRPIKHYDCLQHSMLRMQSQWKLDIVRSPDMITAETDIGY